MAKSGRPSDYTPELAEALFQRLEDGESLAAICRDPAMPTKRTILRWVQNREGFAEEYHLARWAAAETFDDEARELVAGIKNREDAIAARAKFEILRWRAGVHAPRIFGEKIGAGRRCLMATRRLGFRTEVISDEPHCAGQARRGDRGLRNRPVRPCAVRLPWSVTGSAASQVRGAGRQRCCGR